MTVRIEIGDIGQIRGMIAQMRPLSQREQQGLDISLAITSRVWLGWYENEVVCAWGIITPTLLSDQAHLWLHTSPKVGGHEFLFVRYSQRVVELLLEEYPLITGLTDPSVVGAVRWLRWLGAAFGEPQGKYIPFTIRKK